MEYQNIKLIIYIHQYKIWNI